MADTRSGVPEVELVPRASVPAAEYAGYKVLRHKLPTSVLGQLDPAIRASTVVTLDVSSFDGQIYASHGRAGEQFTITESDAGAASGVFVTRCSAGATPAERRQKLALPPSNTAEFESPVALTRNQMLLEGKVAPQLQWGPDKTGGGGKS